MRKQKQPVNQIIKSLEELISDYDRDTLSRALQSVKANDIGWQIFRAILIKEYQSQVIYALEHASKSGEQIEASFRSGCAQTLLDTATTLIDKYINVLQNKAGVVQDIRPEE
jgi:hypothetical protein